MIAAATKALDAAKPRDLDPGGAVEGRNALGCGSHLGPRWYVVQTHRGAERMAVEELANQHFASLLPMRRIDPLPQRPEQPRQHRRRDELPRLAPAFPGYLFVLFDRAAQPWRTIHSTRGVRRLFSASPEHPLPVPVGVVERIMVRLSKDMAMALPESVEDPIPEGAIVRVRSGPVAGQPALCIRGTGKTVRVQLLVSGWEMDLPRSAIEVEPG